MAEWEFDTNPRAAEQVQNLLITYQSYLRKYSFRPRIPINFNFHQYLYVPAAPHSSTSGYHCQALETKIDQAGSKQQYYNQTVIYHQR